MPRFDLQEAVARFFPTSTGYDRRDADRLIAWLGNCGYEIVPKQGDYRDVSLVPAAADRLPVPTR
jgi:hypothetical protein